MRLIETKTLTSAQPTISFTDIPQNFMDLVLVASARGGRAQTINGIAINFNSTTSGVTVRSLWGSGSGGVASNTDVVVSGGVATGSDNTANTFGSSQIYIPNYTRSTNKSFSVDSVNENNAQEGWQWMNAGLWSNTAAITSIQLTSQDATNFQVGTTISLYGIGGVGDGYAPKATGGEISFVNGYWVHTFTSSGTFTPTASLTNVEYLVVGGGGGGGKHTDGGASWSTGGGGAGGYRSSVVGELSGGNSTAEGRLSLAAGTNYTVTIGAGGGAGGLNSYGGDGQPSTFGSITSLGGGGGAWGGTGGTNGKTGGSGGGSASSPSAGGAGTTGQGFAGRTSTGGFDGAGGGGASQTPTGRLGGNGLASSISGSSVFYAGGGGSGTYAGAGGAGGSGGGGVGSTNSGGAGNGAPNTGGGGGGTGCNVSGISGPAGSGGSGIVIVRYAA